MFTVELKGQQHGYFHSLVYYYIRFFEMNFLKLIFPFKKVVALV